jgi:uncharacterized protein (DUF58 family)
MAAPPISGVGALCALRGGVEAQGFELEPIEAGGPIEARLRLTPRRRGALRLEGLSVGAPDPLGLFRAMSFIPAQERLLILPTRYALGSIRLEGGRRRQADGLRFAASVGERGDFSGLREYRRGDPLRHIHWPSWARLGRPVVKEFEDEYCVRQALILDTFLETPALQGARYDDLYDLFEDAVATAASFVVADREQDALLDLLFVAERAYVATAGRGLGGADQLLETLALIGPQINGDFSLLRDSVLERASLVSGCVCVFLGWDAARQELAGALLARGVDVLALCVVGPDAPELDPGPLADRPERFKLLRRGAIAAGLASL